MLKVNHNMSTDLLQAIGFRALARSQTGIPMEAGTSPYLLASLRSTPDT